LDLRFGKLHFTKILLTGQYLYHEIVCIYMVERILVYRKDGTPDRETIYMVNTDELEILDFVI